MKKILFLCLLITLSFTLFSCGETTTDPSTAETIDELVLKADELISNIGEVSLNKKTDILAAEAFYNTLTDEQKAQVKQYEVLQDAISTLTKLDEEQQYENTYQAALKYEKNLNMDLAFAEYQKIPKHYKDVSNRMETTELLSKLSGRWTCDKITNLFLGKEVACVYQGFTLTVINAKKEGTSPYWIHMEGDFFLGTPNNFVDNEMIMHMMIDDADFETFDKLPSGEILLSEVHIGSTYDLYMKFYYTNDGNIRLEAEREGRYYDLEYIFSKAS